MASNRSSDHYKLLEIALFTAGLVIFNFQLLTGGLCESMIFLQERVKVGEWWRAVFHPFVHLTWYHLLLDGGAFLLLYKGLHEQVPLKRIGYVAACEMGSLLISILSSPVARAQGLCGLSGIAHGLMAISAIESIERRYSADGKWSASGVISFLIVVTKSIIELLQGHVFFEFLHFGMMGSPVPESHAGGVLSGIVAYLLFRSSRLYFCSSRTCG